MVTDRASFTWWTVDDIRVPAEEKKEEAKDLKEGKGGNGSLTKREEEEAAIREGLVSRHTARAKAGSVSEQNSSRALSFFEKYSEIQVCVCMCVCVCVCVCVHVCVLYVCKFVSSFVSHD